MANRKKYTGIAIALAWPQTFCKQPGSWYDPLTLRLGFNMNHYYRVGHAAVVLIDIEHNKCHYFDFGRYHTPFQSGRVRSAETDPELEMKITPVISNDKKLIVNFRELVSELYQNEACHGEGDLHASYSPVNFQAAHDKATQMQQASPIPYGPFRIKGSNCSRFVNTVIRAGISNLRHRFRLKYLVPFTPTPMNNVNALDHKMVMADPLNYKPFIPEKRLDNKILKSTLTAPPKDDRIPENAQWLSGEGAGSWFVFEEQDSQLKVTRYSPEGSIECSGRYTNRNGEAVDPDNFRITYPSNCKVVSLTNDTTELRFEKVLEI